MAVFEQPSSNAEGLHLVSEARPVPGSISTVFPYILDRQSWKHGVIDGGNCDHAEQQTNLNCGKEKAAGSAAGGEEDVGQETGGAEEVEEESGAKPFVPVVLEAKRDQFERILLTLEMMQDHLPDQYLSTISRL